MRARPLGALLVVAGIALTACGSGGSSADSSPPSSAPSTTAAANDGGTNAGSAFGDNVVVKSGTSNLGPLLVGNDGKSLYAFTNDTNATSTCFGTCATAWPPLIVPEDWQPGPGLDSAVFSSIIRTDGQRQLVAGKYPLYHFSGDAAPGDVNGQGSAGVWFAVAPNASLIQGAGSGSASGSGSGGAGASAAPPATVGQTSLGQALVDDKGHTLYGLTKDSAGTSTCVDACANAWPPVIVQGTSVPAGLDGNVFSVIARPDGSHQLKAGKWPLYRFSGDAAAGDVNGQGSGGVWFVVAPNGSLNKG
jgi:predicted lipoprotein with Yx(FWY)xxD motif